jgi:hypothetical protein
MIVFAICIILSAIAKYPTIMLFVNNPNINVVEIVAKEVDTLEMNINMLS